MQLGSTEEGICMWQLTGGHSKACLQPFMIQRSISAAYTTFCPRTGLCKYCLHQQYCAKSCGMSVIARSAVCGMKRGEILISKFPHIRLVCLKKCVFPGQLTAAIKLCWVQQQSQTSNCTACQCASRQRLAIKAKIAPVQLNVQRQLEAYQIQCEPDL